MLRQFSALPTEGRARAMLDRDYLWCLANLLLDGEEELERLCPQCRARAEEDRCPVCGQPAARGEGGDWRRGYRTVAMLQLGIAALSFLALPLFVGHVKRPLEATCGQKGNA